MREHVEFVIVFLKRLWDILAQDISVNCGRRNQNCKYKGDSKTVISGNGCIFQSRTFYFMTSASNVKFRLYKTII
jgi:hypothetical protein